MILKKNKKLITHNGSFHADDLFAAAVLSMLHNGNIKIIRTRDKSMMQDADYVFDVGGIYDEEKRRFDHHQKGMAGVRPNGIPYAAFGLVWKAYGEKICGDKEVADLIDSKIVQAIDAKDNGVDTYKPLYEGVSIYGAQQIFLAYSPTWKEDNKNIDEIFKQEVKKIVPLLKREIEVAKADVEGKHIIMKAYEEAKDKRVIILETSLPRYLVQDVLPALREPIYFICPSGHGEFWKAEAIRENLSTMKSRKLFPESWRGLLNRDIKLKEMTGVSDFLFCHANGFLITVEKKESAIKLVEIALQSN